jgi:hypothetical protein
MLGKLLKHEFRATGRIMGPLYLVLLLLSIGGNPSIRMLETSASGWLPILSGLILAAFGLAIVGVCIMSVVLMVNRFRSNLLSDEGYVMFSLPVSVHELVWSKIIVSTVWFIATFFAVALSGLIVAFRVKYVSESIAFLRELFQKITSYYAINGAAFLLEALVLIFIGCASLCLLFYAAMAVGHSFANHKILLSVAFFFGFQFATQMVGSVVAFALTGFNFNWSPEPMEAIHAAMGAGIACALIYGAIFYFVTTFMLKKHLNLE